MGMGVRGQLPRPLVAGPKPTKHPARAVWSKRPGGPQATLTHTGLHMPFCVRRSRQCGELE